jgi:transcriptional regulator with XRE-family HTH domain
MSTPQPALTHADSGASAFGFLLRGWRNTRKLSQLELALQAGISQRHLSFLESGRARPSREMVLGLTETLDVPLRERNNLLTAAGFAPVYRQRDLAGAEMEPVRKALELTLRHHEPYPAVVVDREWNMVMTNAASLRLFGQLGDPVAMWTRACGHGPQNVMKVTFHPQGLQPYIANWDSLGLHMLNRLRREAAAAPQSGSSTLLKEILGYPTVPEHWKVPDWEKPLTPVLPMEVRKGELTIRMFSLIASFGTPQDITVDELRVETFFPADPDTERLMQQLAKAAG